MINASNVPCYKKYAKTFIYLTAFFIPTVCLLSKFNSKTQIFFNNSKQVTKSYSYLDIDDEDYSDIHFSYQRDIDDEQLPNIDLELARMKKDLDDDIFSPIQRSNIETWLEDLVPNERNFHFHGNDLMVFLHIQKTGGTSFGIHLVDDLDRCKRSSVKRRACNRGLGDDKDVWIFSRYSTGWSCGLHADFTELKSCVPEKMKTLIGEKAEKLNYFWITGLRDPVERYVSEWRHVHRGATWKTATLTCDSVQYANILKKSYLISFDIFVYFLNIFSYGPQLLDKCFDDNWRKVSLSEFLDCKYNLAQNRQTRMLANLTEHGCYSNIYPTDSWSYDRTMRKLLDSAKRNLLEKISFFMLVEYQTLSQYAFERTFGVKFKKPFVQKEETNAKKALEGKKNLISAEDVERIREANKYDIEFYKYAKKLFFKRVEELRRLEKMNK